MDSKRIRRCRNCGYKTHRRYWEKGVCPICETASPYVESNHGGLNPDQISIAKRVLRYYLDLIEGDNTPISIERGN
jgi:hypothetical protein